MKLRLNSYTKNKNENEKFNNDQSISKLFNMAYQKFT